MGWIQTPYVGKTKSSCDWDVESEAMVVIGSQAHVVGCTLLGRCK